MNAHVNKQNNQEHGYLAFNGSDRFAVQNQVEGITFAKLTVPGDGYCTIHAFVMLLICRIQANELLAENLSDALFAELHHSYKQTESTVKATIQHLSNRDGEQDTAALAALSEISEQLSTTHLLSTNAFIQFIKNLNTREKLIAAMFALSPALHHMARPNEVIPTNGTFISTDAQVDLIEKFKMDVTLASPVDGELITYHNGSMFKDSAAGVLTSNNGKHYDYVLIHNGSDHCDFGVNNNKLATVSTLRECANTNLAQNGQLPQRDIAPRDTRTAAREIAEAAARTAMQRSSSSDSKRHINDQSIASQKSGVSNTQNVVSNAENASVDPTIAENLHLVLSRNTRHASQEICDLISSVDENTLIDLQEAFDDEFAKALQSQNETVAFNTALKALNKPQSDFAKLLKKLGLFSAADSTSAVAATASAEMHPSAHQLIPCP